jgi:hypothetical protein
MVTNTLGVPKETNKIYNYTNGAERVDMNFSGPYRTARLLTQFKMLLENL